MPKKIIAKSILNKTKRRDPWFLDDYSINPYSACSFNCLYCYIRGSKYGENLEKNFSYKENAVDLLFKELRNRAKKNQYGIIVLASATDPYPEVERELQLTKRLLEVIAEYRFPVHMITKGELITRDIDLLKSIHENAILPNDLDRTLEGGTIISFSFSTLDKKVADIFEPGAPSPESRLKTFTELSKQGLYSGISMMPMLPYITDTAENLAHMFRTFKNASTKYLLPATITLYGNGRASSKVLVFDRIRRYFPDLLPKYERLFSTGYQLPKYYRDAFDRKTDDLSSSYGIPKMIGIKK